MIKRTLIVISFILGIVFIPYFLGMIEIFPFLKDKSFYAVGLIYLWTVSIIVFMLYLIYDYIRYNK